jgi:hypothetical protein
MAFHAGVGLVGLDGKGCETNPGSAAGCLAGLVQKGFGGAGKGGVGGEDTRGEEQGGDFLRASMAKAEGRFLESI